LNFAHRNDCTYEAVFALGVVVETPQRAFSASEELERKTRPRSKITFGVGLNIARQRPNILFYVFTRHKKTPTLWSGF